MKHGQKLDIPPFVLLSKDVGYVDFKRCFKHCVADFSQNSLSAASCGESW